MTNKAPDHLHQLRVEMAKLGGVDPKHLAYQIPHLEGWTVADVVGHTGWIARYVTRSLAAPPDEPPKRADIPEPPAGEAVINWFDEARRELADTFESTDLQALRPTFTGPQPASWWLRRLSHEAAMHRWDANAATGSPEPIDAGLARDGVEEILHIMVPARAQFDLLKGTGQTIHLHATDIDDGEWLVTLNQDSIEASHGHHKADIAARGPISDLLLMLWSRLPPSRLELYGDASLLDRWQNAVTI